MANAVGWFEIYVEDMERARRFYETVLGVKLERLDPGDELLCGEFFLEIGQAIAPEAGHHAGAILLF